MPYFPPEFHNFHPDRARYWDADGEMDFDFCGVNVPHVAGLAPFHAAPPLPLQPYPVLPTAYRPSVAAGYWGDVSGLGGTRSPVQPVSPVHYYPSPPPALPYSPLPAQAFVPPPQLSPFEDRRTWQEQWTAQDYDYDYSRQAAAAGASYDPSAQGVPMAMFPNVPADQTVDPGLDAAIAGVNYGIADYVDQDFDY
jgi:hypothetical protein